MPGPPSRIQPSRPASLLARRPYCLYHQQTKNLLVSYSPKKLGLF
ncbi:hypothetical protein [Streptomyces sp. NPDC127033]